jgi:adenylate kinase
VIYDGFPRTIAQAEALDTMLASRNEKIDALLSLEVPHDELVKRILIRSESSGRSDDADLNTIENRITVYNQKTQPLIDFYIQQEKHYSILGTGTIEEISERLITKVKTLE